MVAVKTPYSFLSLVSRLSLVSLSYSCKQIPFLSRIPKYEYHFTMTEEAEVSGPTCGCGATIAPIRQAAQRIRYATLLLPFRGSYALSHSFSLSHPFFSLCLSPSPPSANPPSSHSIPLLSPHPPIPPISLSSPLLSIPLVSALSCVLSMMSLCCSRIAP